MNLRKEDFTEYQLELMKMYSEGSGYKAIGAKFNKSVTAVQNNIRNLRRKLGADTVCHLICKAIREGII